MRSASGAAPTFTSGSAGALAAFAALAYVLYTEREYSIAAILVNPPVMGLIAGWLAVQVAPLCRWLTPRSVRRRRVLQAAQSTFYEKGVRHTSGKTGILVYVSLTERRAELVADSGVITAMGKGGWQEAAAGVVAVVASGGDGVATGAAIERLGQQLAPPNSLFVPRQETSYLRDHLANFNEPHTSRLRRRARGAGL